MQTRFHVRKNDHVLVLTGKDKGKTGVVLEMLPHKRRATVEGIHMIKRHTRPNPQAPQGGVVEKEGTINIANLKLICPKCSAAARTKRGTFEKEIGGRTKKYHTRVCRKCGESVERD